MKLIKRFLKEDSGLETIEYAILAALIVMAVVGIVATLGDNISSLFSSVDTEVQKGTS